MLLQRLQVAIPAMLRPRPDLWVRLGCEGCSANACCAAAQRSEIASAALRLLPQFRGQTWYARAHTHDESINRAVYCMQRSEVEAQADDFAVLRGVFVASRSCRNPCQSHFSIWGGKNVAHGFELCNMNRAGLFHAEAANHGTVHQQPPRLSVCFLPAYSASSSSMSVLTNHERAPALVDTRARDVLAQKDDIRENLLLVI